MPKVRPSPSIASRRVSRKATPAKQPKRSTPTKGERTRARLVSAAIEEFGSRGFKGTTVSHIVRRAGVSQPAFYLYFSSKEQIYKHLVKRVRQELGEVIEGARVPPNLTDRGAADKAQAAVKAFLQYFADNPKLASIGYFEAGSSSSISENIAGVVARNVAAEQSEGYFRRDFQAMFLSECYTGSLDRVIKEYLLTGKGTASQLAEQISDIYLNGMLPKRR
jgi:TetR/AcrR family fatty acid metabolism transcriptional regulator